MSRASNLGSDSEGEELYDDSDIDEDYNQSDESFNNEDDNEEAQVDQFIHHTPAKLLKGLLKNDPQTPLRTPKRGRPHKVNIDMVSEHILL